MNSGQIVEALAALMYYQSESRPVRRSSSRSVSSIGTKSSPPPEDKREKPVSFEALEEEKRTPWLSLAASVLSQIDQLNLRLVKKLDEKKEAEIKAILKDRIEAAVKEFFGQVRVWKKDLIPQEELVARIYQIWATL